MRKLIVVNIVSLDGYYEGPAKNVMDLFSFRAAAYPVDDGFDRYNLERLRTADTLLLGHKSFKAFGEYWRTVADDESADPVARETSRLMNAMPKVVVSDDPVLLGGGTPLMRENPGIPLRLIDARAEEGAGTAFLRYAAR